MKAQSSAQELPHAAVMATKKKLKKKNVLKEDHGPKLRVKTITLFKNKTNQNTHFKHYTILFVNCASINLEKINIHIRS